MVVHTHQLQKINESVMLLMYGYSPLNVQTVGTVKRNVCAWKSLHPAGVTLRRWLPTAWSSITWGLEPACSEDRHKQGDSGHSSVIKHVIRETSFLGVEV